MVGEGKQVTGDVRSDDISEERTATAPGYNQGGGVA
jgi:hypothetical protein